MCLNRGVIDQRPVAIMMPKTFFAAAKNKLTLLFSEPDLPPLVITPHMVETAVKEIITLPIIVRKEL
jgi:hypothetical protein